ncbi:MAG: class I SAM-dependent methyltransferase, partial [Ilumatobacteraceae bacterium]
MDGFHDSSYGDAFADVYDEWYAGISDVDATVADLVDLADGGSVLELGVGTGRLALPLVAALGPGADVVGVDSSVAMLARLHDLDAEGRVRTVTGDMVDDVPDGPFALVVIAYNTLFSLATAARQAACFSTV